MQEHTVYYSNESRSNEMWFEFILWNGLVACGCNNAYTLYVGVFFPFVCFFGLINNVKSHPFIGFFSFDRQISWFRLNWFRWSDAIPSPTTSHGKNWCKTHQIELSRFVQPELCGLINRPIEMQHACETVGFILYNYYTLTREIFFNLILRLNAQKINSQKIV